MAKRNIRLDTVANCLTAVSTSIFAIATVWFFIAYREKLKNFWKICKPGKEKED